ncbi:hypothetical protein GALL_429920 [mine drainage metagenome]|uniref:Uncharacterized protein n=1 Tax=mine drainage metagenome TaxID=410659 RepID=A0A1J5QH75_9ZZZZ
MRSLEAAGGIFCREHTVHVKRFGYAFDLLEAEVLKIKSRRYETPRRFRDEHRVGGGKGLQTRGDIRRLSHRVHRPRITVTNFADNNRARANAHPTSQGNRPWNLRNRGCNLQGGVNGANGVILVRLGPAEKGHHPIAEIAGGLASIAPDGGAALSPIRINEFLQILRVQLLRELRGSHQVAEHHCDLAEFGFAMLHRRGGLRGNV